MILTVSMVVLIPKVPSLDKLFLLTLMDLLLLSLPVVILLCGSFMILVVLTNGFSFLKPSGGDLKFFDKELKILRSDAVEIFNSSEVQLFLEEHRIKHQFSVPYEHYQNRIERLIQHNVKGISSLIYAQKRLPANYWEHAAKHFVRVSRFVPTRKTAPSTPSHMIGAGDLDLSVKLHFSFGDFVAVRIPDAEKKWKFDLRGDLGIYLGDADDTKRGSLILNPSTGSVQVRLDCIKLELSDQMLHSYYDSRLRLSDARPPIVRIKNAKIDFESFPELDDDFPVDPMRVSWQDWDGQPLHGGVFFKSACF